MDTLRSTRERARLQEEQLNRRGTNQEHNVQVVMTDLEVGFWKALSKYTYEVGATLQRHTEGMPIAIVFALKQFRHYLLGRKLQLVTDHAPLQWLSAQKMEGMLCRWALAMQEFSFDISYRKGSLNGNADALSRRIDSGEVDTAAVTTTEVSLAEIRAAEQGDEVIGKIYHLLSP